MKYEHLSAGDVEQIGATATAAPALDYAVLLPAWEADHAAHAAQLAADPKGDDADTHREALKTLEEAITAGRKARDGTPSSKRPRKAASS